MTYGRRSPRGPWRPGHDPRAVRHLARPGGRSRPRPDGRSSQPVVVVGGGIAGLAAATGLAERGVPVVLVEPEEQLGGRVRAWPTTVDGDQTTMSRGFHAFFRQYYNLRSLLRRTDPGLDRLRPIEDYPLVLADGPQDSFARIPRRPPLSLMAFVLQSPSFPLRDLARVNAPAALELMKVDFPSTFWAYDGESAAEFLDRLRFPPMARHLALEVFARSFFALPSDFSAGELVGMFHTYFLGSAEGLLFDVPRDDYDTALWAPLGRYLQTLGVEIRTGESVTGLTPTPDGLEVQTSRSAIAAAGVVLAADPMTTRRLLLELPEPADGDGDAAWRERVGALRTAPPFAVWRLWLDREADAERPPFLGTSGYGPLDNVSLVERFEDGAARWTATHGGSVVELHAYALPEPVDEAAVQHRLRTELDRIYPELAGAGVVAEQWLVRQDCPLSSPAPWHDRLTVTTPDPRLVLAGDSIRCDYPVALMERAATTGFLAANALLAQQGRPGHDLWTVPMRGLLAPRSAGAPIAKTA